MREGRSPFATGVWLALLAALSFGLTTPVIERAGRGTGALSTAALLYVGASISAWLLGRLSPSSGAPLRRAQWGRLLLIALVGAGLAPTLLAWGLQRAGAMTGSLLLNLEVVFTVCLARAVYREPVAPRIGGGLTLMVLGGVALAFAAGGAAHGSVLGAVAVAAATAAWAVDNTLTRGLAEQDPVAVVAIKGALGATLTGLGALVLREPTPQLQPAVILLACGATGYGLSLRLYLVAQRRIGAARTASIFAVAPFVGAAAAWAVSGKGIGAWTLVSAALFGAGVLIHATERHQHRHAHGEIEHEHPHRHDDGHHDHTHDPPVVGEHVHPHRHEHVEHEHEHAPDVHHQHAHD